MRNKVSFELNVPIEVALQFAQGKTVEGRFGPQVMFSLTDNQVMFLDLAVADQVGMLQPAVGECFQICKRSAKRGGTAARWDVWLSPDSEKRRAMQENPGGAWTSPPRPRVHLPAEAARNVDAEIARIRAANARPIGRPSAAAVSGPPPINWDDLPTERRAPVAATSATPPIALGTGTNGPVAQHIARTAAVPVPAAATMADFLVAAGRATRTAEIKLAAEGAGVRFNSADVTALAIALFRGSK
jgi:hypothetical protein